MKNITACEGKPDRINEDVFKIKEEMESCRMKNYQAIDIESLRDFIDLLNSSTDGYLYVWDFQTDAYYISARALERFRLDTNSFHNVLEEHRKFIYDKDYPVAEQEFEELQKPGGRRIHNMRYRWIDKDAKPVWINCRGYVIRKPDGRALYMVGCINEIGVKQKADNVSGLLGESVLKEYLNKMKPQSPQGYILRLGLDNFREINEKFGTEYGDMILRETAESIAGCISKGQRLYKMDADEFMIIDFFGSNADDAQELFDRIRQALLKFVGDNGFDVVFTISGGILLCSEMEEYSYDNIMKLTEFALCEAKIQGKNRSYLFCQKDYDAFLRKRKMARVLREAVNQDFKGFSIFFQPLFLSDRSTLYGAEALMRFNSEEFGQVSPAEFIPILEETGLIIPAGRWIMLEALRKCRNIRKYLPNFRVSVNVSNIQVSKTNLYQEILSALKEADILPSALIIEVTESGFLEFGQDAERLWTKLKELGVSLALDDFGTGYSNFHYLSELKPEIVKIDRSFLAKALNDEAEYNLLYLLCSMFHTLELKICIEGVENEYEWQGIQAFMPDYSQGYFWGTPCSYENFMERFVIPSAKCAASGMS